MTKGYTVNQLMAYEEGAMTPEQERKLFSALIKSGDAWRLQGHYGRTAQAYIESGQIDSKGRIKRKMRDVL